MTEVAVIQSLQSLHGQFLLWFFEALTLLGSGEFYIAAIPVIYWCINKQLGYRLGIVFLASMLFNLWLKGIVNRPRPLPSEVKVLFAETASGPSFPSGHAQGSATFWGFLASRFRSRRYQTLAVALIILISLSRVYLGLHYPTDVFAGMAFGLGFVMLEEYIVQYQRKLLGASLVLLLLVAIAYMPSGQTIKMLGAMLGLSSGYLLTCKYNNFTVQASLRIQFLKISAGALILGIIKVAGKYLLPPSLFTEVFIYLILTFTAVYLIPYLFVRWGWSIRERPLAYASQKIS